MDHAFSMQLPVPLPLELNSPNYENDKLCLSNFLLFFAPIIREDASEEFSRILWIFGGFGHERLRSVAGLGI